MPIDHIGLKFPPSKFGAAKAFYAATLAPLGYKELMNFTVAVGFGPSAGPGAGKPDFWISQADAADENGEGHVAFAAADRNTVDAFHAAALAAGATCNGAPGVREQYHPDYYGAFVLDPIGNNIEAVCHGK